MQDDQAWTCKPFSQLTADDVYDLLQLRADVFVVEQECAYLDPDGMDRKAWHWLYRSRGELAAYQRCLPPGAAYDEYSAIGRIVVAQGHRGSRTGRKLVQRGIEFNRQTWPHHAIQISAQSYLEAFYTSLGFAACGESYLEDGIPHLPMRVAHEALR